MTSPWVGDAIITHLRVPTITDPDRAAAIERVEAIAQAIERHSGSWSMGWGVEVLPDDLRTVCAMAEANNTGARASLESPQPGAALESAIIEWMNSCAAVADALIDEPGKTQEKIDLVEFYRHSIMEAALIHGRYLISKEDGQ